MQRLALVLVAGLFLIFTCPARGLGAQDGVDWGPWMRLGPFDNSGGAGGPTRILAPEKDLHRFKWSRPGPRLDTKWEGKGGRVLRWDEVVHSSAHDSESAAVPPDQSVIDLAIELEDALASDAATYLYRSIEVREDRDLEVLFGVDDGFRVWLNGEVLLTQGGSRSLNRGEFSATLPLKDGRNHLLVKVVNGGGAWAFQMLYDAEQLARVKGDLAGRVNSAIDRGVDYLLSRQYPDGSWSFHSYPYRNGQTALSLYALLKSGLPPTHPACVRAVQFLKARRPARTYSAACMLMAFEAMHDESLRDDMEAACELLLEWRSGGYAYPQGALDLSNTQYGALGLRAAARAGIGIRDKVWVDLAEHVLEYTAEDGGFCYRPGGSPTGSMTAAGLTVLGIAREARGKKGLPAKLESEVKRATQAGLDWLRRNWTVNSNPRADAAASTRWHPYYLYGLERVGGLFGLERLGGFDWYADGAQRLTLDQQGAGNWGTPYGEPEPNTAFALLFLERATAPISGHRTRKERGQWGGDDAAQPLSLRAKGKGPITVWISSWGADTLGQHTWPRELGGGLRVRRVEYLVDGEVLQSVEGDPTRPTELERYPARLGGIDAGEHILMARVTLAKPPPDSADVRIESAPVPFSADRSADPATLYFGRDARQNLLRDAAYEVRASSAFGDSYAPQRALDGRMSTCWLAANTEEQQSFTLELKRALKADTLLLSQAFPHVDQPEHCARITELLLVINGNERKAMRISMDPSVLHKTSVDLGRAQTIRRLEVRVLESLRGQTQPFAVGIAELELLRRNGRRR